MTAAATTTITYVYCSHCLQYSKAAIEAKFYSCSTCGKVVSEINVKGNSWSVMKKKCKTSGKTLKLIKPNSPHEP